MKILLPLIIIFDSYLFKTPPINEVNFNSELWRMWDKIEVVVVLPWVPAIAIQKLELTISASRSALLTILKLFDLK